MGLAEASVLVVAVLLVVAAALLLGPARASTATSQAAARAMTGLRGYPPPPAATATPAPAPDGRFPPPSAPHVVIPLDDAPHGELLRPLARALAAADSATIADWVEPSGGLPMERTTDSEGYGARWPPDDLAALLDELFAAGSQPVIQGTFDSPGCAAAGSRCWPWVVITGWQGQPAMPTKDPAEVLGPEPPATVPVAVSAWEIAYDAEGPYLARWWIGDGYYEFVEDLAERGWGTYTVIR